ncbi:MAG: phage tail sheath C-terminal domain-containing protein [Alphaproteobacteria bacterium]|nr:phage tail sheath C-terminal domain-containing protein [Alphaproteobacteria bacterium]
MAIQFNQIPVNLRVPGTYIEISNEKANRGLSQYPTKALVVGQKLVSGTATPLTPYLITNIDTAKTLFGAGSQLTHMLEKFKEADNFLEVWGIAQIDNAIGVQATGKLSITGPATGAGTIELYVAGRKVQIGVAAAATASTIATAVADAINALTSLPVTAAVNGINNYEVDVTARHKGVNGNAIDLRVNFYQDEILPAGVGVAITDMANGATNPDLSVVFAALGDDWYTDIISAYNDTANLVVLENALSDRFGPLKMLEGHGYIAYSDTHSNLVTKGQGRNSPHVSAIGAKGSPTPTYEWAASLGAVCASSSNNDAARPVQRLVMPGILAPKIADRFDLDERNILLFNGISTWYAQVDGTVITERVITGYRLNIAGAADPSYLDIETLKTLSYLRYDTRTLINQRFPRYKLADDGTNFGEGQAIVTPRIIRNTLIGRFLQWEENGLVEGREQFKKDLLVERDGSDRNRVNAIIPPDIINQFRVFAGKVEFYL